MPLSSYWIASLVLSVVGLVLFLYGKRAPSLVIGIAGIALMIEPMFLFNGTVLWAVGTATFVLMLIARQLATRLAAQKLVVTAE